MTLEQISELSDTALRSLSSQIKQQLETREKASEEVRQRTIAIHTKIIHEEIAKLKGLGAQTIIINHNTIRI